MAWDSRYVYLPWIIQGVSHDESRVSSILTVVNCGFCFFEYPISSTCDTELPTYGSNDFLIINLMWVAFCGETCDTENSNRNYIYYWIHTTH